MLIASPVSTCDAGQLVCLANLLGIHQMRAGTKVCEITLSVKADLLTFWQILDQFYLVWLFFLFHQSDRLVSWKGETLDRKCLFYDLLHLCFDLL